MNNAVLQEGSFSITKDQLRQLTDPKIKEWFPEVFSLPENFTGWVRCRGDLNKKWLTFFEKGLQKYGFDGNGYWFAQNEKVFLEGNEFEATKKEIFEALRNEAVKRYSKKDYVNCLYSNKNHLLTLENISSSDDIVVLGIDRNYLWMNARSRNVLVFDNGKWANIIQAVTKQEAEKLLNKKIID